jgi:PAS domain S-box-containing protein
MAKMSYTPTILIADDDSSICESLQILLSDCDYEIHVANSGMEAIGYLDKFNFDLALLDIVMPEIGGFQVMDHMSRQSPDTVVIVITGDASMESAIEALKKGAYYYVIKPFGREELLKTIENALDKKRFKAEKKMAEEALQKAHEELEIKVEERTKELLKTNEQLKKEIKWRKKAEEMLRKSEKRFRSIIESVNDVIFQLSPLGFINYVTPNVEELYGYKPEDLIGKHFETTTPANEMPKALEAIKSVLSEKIVKNFEINQVDGRGNIVPMEINITPLKKDGKIISLQGVIRDITKRRRAEEGLNKSIEKLRKALDGTIQAMSLTVEIRDPYTAGHQRRVAELSRSIAIEMGLSEEQINGISMAGVVHDLGKISVPAEILSKPGQITHIELSLIRDHPQVGYDILKKIEFPWEIAQIVLQHHERSDGSGYPRGLSGENIFIEAKILAVADVIEAMASHRPYRPSLGLNEALREISENRGVLYDPKVVDACIKLFSRKKFTFN